MHLPETRMMTHGIRETKLTAALETEVNDDKELEINEAKDESNAAVDNETDGDLV